MPSLSAPWNKGNLYHYLSSGNVLPYQAGSSKFSILIAAIYDNVVIKSVALVPDRAWVCITSPTLTRYGFLDK